MALVEQIRGLDSTIGSVKTVVGALTTKPVSGQGNLIQGWDDSSYVYYAGAGYITGGDWSIFGDLENIQGAGNANTVFAQGGATGSGGGFRITYRYGDWRITLGGIGDYDFEDVALPSSGPARWGITYNRTTSAVILYINGLKAILAADMTIPTIPAATSPNIIIGAAWNGSGYSDITGSDARNVNGNLDVYDTLFDAAQVANEYATYLNTGVSQVISFTLEDVIFSASQTANHSQSFNVALDDIAFTVAQKSNHPQVLAITLEDIQFTAVQKFLRTQLLSVVLDDIQFTVNQVANHTQSALIVLDDINFFVSQSVSGSISQSINFTLDDINFNAIQSLTHSQSLNIPLDDIAFTVTQFTNAGISQSISIVLDDLVFTANQLAAHPQTFNLNLDDIQFNLNQAIGINQIINVTLDDIQFTMAQVSGIIIYGKIDYYVANPRNMIYVAKPRNYTHIGQ